MRYLKRTLPAMAVAAVAAVLLVSGCAAGGGTSSELDAAIAETTQDPRFANGAWSILAVEAATGETVYELNPTAPLVPGSIMKTFTNGTALEKLGPESRVTTTVRGLGDQAGGVLQGDLVLVGAGDFSFGLRDLPDGTLEVPGFDHNEANTALRPAVLASGDPLSGLRDLADQLAAAGLTDVAGDVVVDNRLFETETEWPDGRIDSIWVNENIFDAIVTPATVGAAPAVELRPGLRAIELVNEAVTVAGDAVEIEVEDLGSGRVRVSGEIGAESDEVIRVAEIDDPVEFARIAFREVLGDAGISVSEAAAMNPEERLPEPGAYAGDPLAARDSATTAERVRLVQKISYNRGADLFGCLIAVEAGSTDCTDGLGVILDTIEAHGAPAGSVFLFDPAGSIDYDRTSAAGQVGFLQGAAQAEWGADLFDAMPISGVDGSLVTFGVGSGVEGAIHAKTGSRIVGYPARNALFYLAQSYSGYLTAESGRELVFTVIFNATTVDSIDAALDVMESVGGVALALHAHA